MVICGNIGGLIAPPKGKKKKKKKKKKREEKRREKRAGDKHKREDLHCTAPDEREERRGEEKRREGESLAYDCVAALELTTIEPIPCGIHPQCDNTNTNTNTNTNKKTLDRS